MSTTVKVLIGLFVVGLLGTAVIVGGVVGINNDMVFQEQGIKAQFDQNKNNYDNYFKKLKEAAQVPDMYTKDLKEVYTAAISGRYGSNGSQATFQWLKEHNPNVDASLYKKIQQIIEAGRDNFEANQKMLVDKKRVYETTLNQFPGGLVAKLLGFPKIDLSKFKIVTSDHTEEAFTKGKSDPIKLE